MIKGTRSDVLAALVAVALVAAAHVVGSHLIAAGVPIHSGSSPPLLGRREPHVGIGTPLAVAVALLVVAHGPQVAARLSWRWLLCGAWAAATAWTVALGLVDGWDWFSTRLGGDREYLAEVAAAPWPDLLPGYTDRILIDAPDNWTTHVAGHPPGALAFFVVLDRLGLGGPAWASMICLVLGTSAVVAIAVTMKALSHTEDRARRALPFLVLVPAAVWIGASADAMFLAVSAWGLALFASASRLEGTARVSSAVGAGLLLVASLYLSYGLALFGLLVGAVLAITKDVRALLLASTSVAAVVGLVTLGGFAWWEGYDLLVTRYYQGWGGERPYSYWVWADIAVLAICVGPAGAVGLRRLLRPADRSWKLGPTWRLVPVAAAAALATATLSGLSKGEVERIWLPYAMWLVPATALLPCRHRRIWLVMQAITALLVQHLVLTRW